MLVVLDLSFGPEVFGIGSYLVFEEVFQSFSAPFLALAGLFVQQIFEVAYKDIDALFERLLCKLCVFQRHDEISAHLESVDLELDHFSLAIV